jgi:two-component system response regulator YesN
MKSACLHESQYQAYIISVMNVLLQIVQRYELDEQEIFCQKSDYYEILLAIRDADTLEKWLTETSLKISANLTCERQDNTKNMIRAAKKYIKENYSNSELSLEMICGYLHISTTYFSTVFKREVGESYTSYLTRIRLEKAAEMLSITQEKTYIIAKEVGYDEPNYFGYVFKKKYGVSPNKYRGK